MRTYLSYLTDKKQAVAQDRAAEGEEKMEDGMEEDEEDAEKKKRQNGHDVKKEEGEETM